MKLLLSIIGAALMITSIAGPFYISAILPDDIYTSWKCIPVCITLFTGSVLGLFLGGIILLSGVEDQ